MLSMENESKVSSTNWKKIGAVVGCTASVAAVAFVASGSSSTAGADSSLMNIPTDFSGEFRTLSDEGLYRADGLFHKYETEEGDWKIDGKVVEISQDDEHTIVYSMSDNVPIVQAYKNGDMVDVQCYDVQSFPTYGNLKTSFENAVAMDERVVDPKLTYKMQTCPEGSSKHVINWMGQNYGVCGESKGDDIFIRAYGDYFTFSVRNNEAVKDLSFEHSENLKMMNCTQLDPKKPMFDIFLEKAGIERKTETRSLSMTQSWPYTDHHERQLGNEYEDGETELGKGDTRTWDESDNGTENSSDNQADDWTNEESGNAQTGNHSTRYAQELGNLALDFMPAGDDIARAGLNNGARSVDYARMELGFTDEAIFSGYIDPVGQQTDESIDVLFGKGNDAWNANQGDNTPQLIKKHSPFQRPAAHNPPGFDSMRCYIFHGIGGVGLNPTGYYALETANLSDYNNAKGLTFLDTPYQNDSNGQKANDYFLYFGGKKASANIYHYDGVGKSCDEVTVMDTNSIDYGYDSATLMEQMCDLYLDGDDKITWNGQTTKNPLHAYGYAHPHDHKVIFTHSMGGMYTYRAFAEQRCEKKLPSSVVNLMTGAGMNLTGTIMETSYYQSQPPMDGSRSAGIPRYLCPLIFKAAILGEWVFWQLLKRWNYAVFKILKLIYAIWKLITGKTIKDLILDLVYGIKVISNGCTPEWEQRYAHDSIERGDPNYRSSTMQDQEFYHADERMCGTSPWGTGGASGGKFCALSLAAGLEWIYRPICLRWLQIPCKCSWRGCAICSMFCLYAWPFVPYNDGAVSYTSCMSWGEGVGRPTLMPVNHDDGTGRNTPGTYANRDARRWYRAQADMARSETLQDAGYVPSTWGGIQVTGHYMHNKFNQAIPKGDRDGSSHWIMEVLAGGLSAGDMHPSSANCGYTGASTDQSFTSPSDAISGLCQSVPYANGETRAYRILAYEEVTGVFQIADSTVNTRTSGVGSSTGTLVDLTAVDIINLGDAVEFNPLTNNASVMGTAARDSNMGDTNVENMPGGEQINNSPFPTQTEGRLSPAQAEWLEAVENGTAFGGNGQGNLGGSGNPLNRGNTPLG